MVLQSLLTKELIELKVMITCGVPFWNVLRKTAEEGGQK